jgi:hypothetical protein
MLSRAIILRIRIGFLSDISGYNAEVRWQGNGIFSSFRSLRRPWLRSLRDFGPSAILLQDQNTPLREHPVPLLVKKIFLVKSN